MTDLTLFLAEIFKLAEEQPKQISAQLARSLKYKNHFKCLCEVTDFAPFPKYSIVEKIWLAKNRMTDFPCCKNVENF